MSLHRSTAWPLTWVAVVLIAYATLHPLTGWHWPERQTFSWVLPKLAYEAPSDLVGNLLGYLPLGAMLTVAHLRSGRGAFVSALLTLLFGAALSYTLELAQFTIPSRVPSFSGWVLNTLGTAWGALWAVTVHALGLVDVWHRWRERWFIPQAGFGLALIWMWPLGLLFPPPLPMGEGQVLPHLMIGLMELTRHTPWQELVLPSDPLTLWADVPVDAAVSMWVPVREAATVALGLWAPMCVACAFALPSNTRVVLLAGAVVMGVGTTALSTAMNFGPQHALTWMSLPTSVGLMMGTLAGTLLLGRSRRTCAGIGVLVLCGLIALIHQVPPDPYYALALESWEHGRFIRFHGLSRWFGILWPYLAMAWLLGRLFGRDARYRTTSTLESPP